jgi:hypothetical protein
MEIKIEAAPWGTDEDGIERALWGNDDAITLHDMPGTDDDLIIETPDGAKYTVAANDLLRAVIAFGFQCLSLTSTKGL